MGFWNTLNLLKNTTTMKNLHSRFERRIQTLVQVIIATVLIWMGNAVVETRQDVAVIKAQMVDVKLDVVQAQTAAATATAAAAAILARETAKR